MKHNNLIDNITLDEVYKPDSVSHFNFNDFYEKYYRRTFLFAKSYVHDKWAAEDISSEALINLWQIMDKHKIHHPLTFLFSIVRNKCIDHLRKEITRQEALTTLSEIGIRELNDRISTLEACDPEKIFSTEVKQIVDKTLATLPEKTRNIFLMSRFENLSREKIATSVGMTTKGVEYHLGKALQSLRVSLKDYMPLFYFLFFYH